MRAFVALACTLACTALAGCGGCRDDAKPAAKEPPPRSAAITAGSGARKPSPTRSSVRPNGPVPGRVATEVTVEEVTPVLPAVAHATLLDAPTAAPNGGQIHLGWCISAGDQKQALAAIAAGLRDGGWTAIHSRGVGARVAISADLAPYRLTASVSNAPRPDCSPANGKFFASGAMYKIAAVTAPPGLAPGVGEPVPPPPP